ncbi:flagellar motor stator protein MotA [Ruficoccus amylovorans]|uniref:Flagellar motor stator protein MotA n=1 Tax=Ruficoccus amylovorans TaxID=1804625 RepID=A0A842HHK4_9BACT|nr:motility-associated protein [Ruficoccus amylovorans]MBC2595027.1 flagellar motor stator protein MotA [Ruficoccus amylovorans]
MIVIIGFIVVLGSIYTGLSIGGGNVLVLWHISEFITVLGICLGVMIIASPLSVLKAIMVKVLQAFRGGPVPKRAFDDIMKMLYQFFMLARKDGLLALEEHLANPEESSICSKYPSFYKNPRAVQFLFDNLRPIVDGRIKPEQVQGMVHAEIETIREEQKKPVHILQMVGDSFPGIGICAAVLGIILTMGSVAEGAETVGHKVAAALTGTFLGVLGAYGFINPLTTLIETNNETELRYYRLIGNGLVGFANGLAPLMSVEMARRALLSSERPEADDLEVRLKEMMSAR